MLQKLFNDIQPHLFFLSKKNIVEADKCLATFLIQNNITLSNYKVLNIVKQLPVKHFVQLST